MTTSRKLLGVTAISLLLGLSACGGGSSAAPSSSGDADGVSVAGMTITKDDALASQLPEKYRSGINALTIAPYAPYMVYGPGNKLEGALIDVADAVAAKLGTKVTYNVTTIDSAIPSLQAGKGDVMVMTLADTADREKAVDFINFGKDGLSLMVKKGNPEGIKSGKDLCGKSVTILAGWSPADTFDVLTQKCEAEGRPAVNIVRLPKTEDGMMAVKAGNASASYVSKSAALSAVKALGANGGIDVVLPEEQPSGWNHQYKGLTVPKGSPLGKPLQAAMESLLADGTLKKIFDKYDVGYILNDKIVSNEALALSNIW